MYFSSKCSHENFYITNYILVNSTFPKETSPAMERMKTSTLGDKLGDAEQVSLLQSSRGQLCTGQRGRLLLHLKMPEVTSLPHNCKVKVLPAVNRALCGCSSEKMATWRRQAKNHWLPHLASFGMDRNTVPGDPSLVPTSLYPHNSFL